MVKRIMFSIALLCIATGLFSFAFVSDDTKFSVVYTPHYKIIFPSEDSLEIPYLAYIAEDVYYYTTGWMDIHPDYRITLIIYDGVDLYNGFSTPLPEPTIFIYLNHPDPFFGNGMKNWYRLLITHELTHTLQMNGNKRKHNLLYSWKMGFWPTWYLEGIAVYNESFISENDGRLNNVLYRSYIRSFVKDNKFPPIMPTMNNENRFFPSGKDYLWGSLAYWKAIKDNGYDKVMEWDKINRKMTDYLFAPIPFYIWGYYKYIRPGVREFANKMKEDLIEMDSISVKNMEKITDKDFYQISPVFDKRDSTLYYWSSPSTDLTYLVKRDKNGKEKRLVEGLYPQSLFLDTINNYLYYEKLNLYKNTDYYYSIYRYNIKTGKEEKIENTLRGTNPVVIGDTMYYVYRMIGKNGIMMMNLKNGRKRNIFSYPFHYQIYGLSISPDNKMAISLWRPGGHTEIDIIGLLSHRIATIVRDTFFNVYPKWSSSGDTLFFLSDREGTYGIYAYSFRDKTLSRYCFTSGLIRDYDITEDCVYYSDLSSSGWNIYKVSKDNLNVFKLDFHKEKYKYQEPYLQYPNVLDSIRPYDWEKNLCFNYITIPYPIGLFASVSLTDNLFKRGFVFFGNAGWLLSPLIGPIGMIAFYNGAYTSYYFISYYYTDLNSLYYYNTEMDRVYTNTDVNRNFTWTITGAYFSSKTFGFGTGVYYSTAKYARKSLLPLKGYKLGFSLSGNMDMNKNYSYLINADFSFYHKNMFGNGKLSLNVAYSNDTINTSVNMFGFPIIDTLGMRRYSLVSYGKVSLPSSNIVNGVLGEWLLPPVYVDNFNLYFIMLGDVSLSLFGELFVAMPSYNYDGNAGISFNIRWFTFRMSSFTTSFRYYYNYSSSSKRWSIVIE